MNSPWKSLQTTLHPERYHGFGKQPPFFEGWYYKLVSANEGQRYAFIPGIILGKNGHAFIQVLDGTTGHSTYHTYPLDDFWAASNEFDINIGQNRFNAWEMVLNLDQDGQQVRGRVSFAGVTPWPVTWLSPGIMGPFAWLPSMECYHGVVSLNHTLWGGLEINGRMEDFSAGQGYIEKDWGQSFPQAWIWFQSNHFDTPQTCVTASIATIPWLGSSFDGFIVGFVFAGRLYRFATYNGGRVEVLQQSDQAVLWIVRNLSHRLEMRASRAGGGLLRGPDRVEMGKRVPETMLGRVDVRLSSLDGEIIYQGRGRNAGLEVFGAL